MTTRRRHRSRRGFTLIELMTALAAGLFVASAAYLLARNSLSSFNEEARMQASQYGSTLGLTRLAADLRRAGYMSTPDIVGEPSRCGPPPPPGDPVRQMLTAIRVIQGGAAGYANDFAGQPTHAPAAILTQASNRRLPDRVTFSGNLTTGEYFQVASMNNDTIVLQNSSAAVARVAAEHADPNFGPTVCDAFLPAGLRQLARVTESGGMQRFVIITGCTETFVPAGGPGSFATFTDVRLTYQNYVGWAPAPCWPFVLTSGTINPVQVGDYSIVNVAAMNDGDRLAYGFNDSVGSMVASTAAEAAITGDADRTELVRRLWALNAGGTPVVVPGSAEIVTEYAVDLSFGVWRTAGPGPAAMLQRLPYKDPGIPGTEPQRLRGLRARLGTRARAPDRTDGPDTNVVGPPAPPPNPEAFPLRRFDVFIGGDVVQRYARVRNATIDIDLRNLRNAQW